MQDMRQQLDPVDEPRPGPREVRGGVDGDRAGGAHGGERRRVRLGLLGRARCVVTARHHDRDVRTHALDVTPVHDP